MRIYVSIVSVLFAFFSIAPTTFSQELSATLNLSQVEGQPVSVIDVDDSFEVILKNSGQSVVSIPDPESSDGLKAIRFVITDPGTKQQWKVTRATTVDGSKATPIEIQPGGSYSFYVSLGEYNQGGRSWSNLPDPNSGREFTIRIELDAGTASCKSPDYPIQFTFARAVLPQQYLWNGFPDVALKKLMADPKLVNQIDEEQRTPLHVAARFGHTKVVKWLLENEADVNAVAYNRFTPLRLADEPEIVRMLLQGGADPNQVDAFGSSPLRHAIAESKRHADSKEEQAIAFSEKWNRVLDVYVEEVAEFELLAAIEMGNLEQVKKLLTADASVLDQYRRVPSIDDQRPLRSAVEFGELEIVQYLLAEFPKKMDVDNFAGGTGYPVSKLALGNRSPAVLGVLIENGADLQRRITWQGRRTGRWVIGDNATLLHFAARDGVPETIRLLLDEGLDPFATARSDTNIGDRQTPLHVAVFFSKPNNAAAIVDHESFQSGDQAKRQKVLDECLTISMRRPGPTTAELCAKLIEAGASVQQEPDQSTLIQSIAESIHPSSTDTDSINEVVEVLEKAGVEIDLYSAVALQRDEQVNQILQQNPELATCRSPEGLPALHMATRLGDINTVRSLLTAGCDVNIQNQSKDSGYFGERALSEAAFWDQEEIAKLLIESGAEVNGQAERQITALHRAARLGNVEMVKVLLDAGADPKLADDRGQTAADWATRPDIRRLLLPKDPK